MPKLPTGELVAVAYAKAALSRASLTAPVSTTLAAVTAWSTTGALQVTGVVGGVARDTDLRDMVVSFDSWAARPGSDKPPWGQANELVEVIRSSAFWDWTEDLELDLEPAGVYSPVRVQGAVPVSPEPRRIPDQDASRAHYSLDFRIFWTVR